MRLSVRRNKKAASLSHCFIGEIAVNLFNFIPKDIYLAILYVHIVNNPF